MSDDEFAVFYAWQSDSDARDNRSFIESALGMALRNIERTGAIEASPRLDKDTKDVPGMPDIANMILEKIRGSDCFLCDVSFVGMTTSDDEDGREPIPNPNVMLELGYALSELGWQRMVFVINTATGSASDLPFDLRNRRWPIRYEVTADADSETRAIVKRKLAKQIEMAIKAIARLPARQKRGSGEQRLDALEEPVGKLSGNVAQYTTLANVEAGLQRGSTHMAKVETEAKEKCLRLRKSLIERILAGKFVDVVVRQGMLAICICPSSTAAALPLFDGDNEHMLCLELTPLYASGWDHERYGDRFVTFSKWDGDIDAATEIWMNGNIFAGGHQVISVGKEFLSERVPDDVLYIPSVAFEKSIIGAVSRYLKASRRLNTPEPWSVGLAIANVKKSALYVGSRLAFGGRVFEGDEILPPVVEIGADLEVGDPQAVARALRPSFDYVWREHNYAGSLNYDDSGDWVGH